MNFLSQLSHCKRWAVQKGPECYEFLRIEICSLNHLDIFNRETFLVLQAEYKCSILVFY